MPYRRCHRITGEAPVSTGFGETGAERRDDEAQRCVQHEKGRLCDDKLTPSVGTNIDITPT
jgi:hypothetical protein